MVGGVPRVVEARRERIDQRTRNGVSLFKSYNTRYWADKVLALFA